MRPSPNRHSLCRRLRLSSSCRRNLIVAVPDQRTIYAILDRYLWIESEFVACLVDHGTTAIRVIDQVVRFRATAQNHFPAIPTHIGGRSYGEVRQIGDGYLRAVNADVVGLPRAAAHQYFEIPRNGVGCVAERTLRFPIGEHDDVAPRENVLGEVRDYAPIGYFQTRTVVVERPRHAHRNVLVLGIHDTQRFTESLRLVVTRPRTSARHVASVVLRGGDRRGGWIAIDLARRIEQEAAYGAPRIALGHRVVQQISQPVDVSIDALERLGTIVDWRGDAGGMNDII